MAAVLHLIFGFHASQPLGVPAQNREDSWNQCDQLMRLITMKRCIALLMMAILALSACNGNDTPGQSSEPAPPSEGRGSAPGPPPSDGWTRVQSRNDLSGLRVAPIEEIAWNDDGTIALVRYVSGAEPCSGSVVTVDESDTMVTFTLETGLTPEAAVTLCVAALFNYEISVPLAAPVGDRAVVLTAAGEAAGAGEREQPDPFEGAEFPTDQYVGLTEAEANDLGSIEQRVIRVVAVDGEFFAVTEDFSPTRVNIELVDGVIVNAYSG